MTAVGQGQHVRPISGVGQHKPAVGRQLSVSAGVLVGRGVSPTFDSPKVGKSEAPWDGRLLDGGLFLPEVVTFLTAVW